jgi:hypothetical protein
MVSVFDERLSRFEQRVRPREELWAVLDGPPRSLSDFSSTELRELFERFERHEISVLAEMDGRTMVRRFVPTPGAPPPAMEVAS